MPYKKILLFFLFLFFLNSSAWSADFSKIQTKPEAGTVTLTFDDGPSPVYTPQVLAILKRYNIHAVFFVMTGIAKQHPEIVKEIVKSGNVVANHTIWHPNLAKLSQKKLEYEIAHSKETIQDIIGKPPVCLRPPFFAANANVTNVIEQHGMAKIMGFMTEDYKDLGVDWLTQNVLKHVHDGMVLVFHDTHRQTVAALPAIIEGIKKKDLGFSLICQ